MDRELLEQRKQMLTELVHDKSYVPMKAKEIAMLLNIPKAMRGELQEVLDELVLEGKLGISKKGKIWKAGNLCSSGYIFKDMQEALVLLLWKAWNRMCLYRRIRPEAP